MRWFIAAVGAVAVVVASVLLIRDLLPPRTLSIATGPRDGGYWRVAERYRTILARDGIELRLIATEGSVDNVGLLAAGKADAALLQGGVRAPDGIEALGAVFLEPLFVFAREDVVVPANAGAWAGLRLALGTPGSGTRATSRALFSVAGIELRDVEAVSMNGAEAAAALLAGELDAALFVAPIEARYLQPLFTSDEVRLVPLAHAQALSRRLAHAEVVPLLAGSLSLMPPVPARDVPLIAMLARLVAQSDLHPALVDRLVEAAREVHSRRTLLTEAGTFPSFEAVAMPLDLYARDLLASGPSPLQAYLPYWMAAQIYRFAILLLPILLLAVPLLRSAPGLYAWQMRHRVDRYYNDIRRLDAEAGATDDTAHLRRLDARLAQIDAALASLRLPLTYRSHAYSARLHVDLVRKRIAEHLGRATAG